ncbi:hypothetical protein KIN20_018363 [Parelaphostrongylus tenuis]|uniref:Uncharacterized protein n=1 Tax=Parelaphostrongylus tenuis TaxID=148309 RepID=A0AAD5QPH9_PARTN|nr:hypothetical protein KIN20_018363 [Parelaphostrongylus tenuis]
MTDDVIINDLGIVFLTRKNERIAVVESYKTGMKTTNIIKLTVSKPPSVCRVVKCFKEAEGMEDGRRKGRKTTSFTRKDI